MNTMTFLGIFSMGAVFGFLLFYAVKHTPGFGIDSLASAFGAVGGGVVVGLFGKTEGWIGPYGLGLLAGFLFYFFMALILFLMKLIPTPPLLTKLLNFPLQE
jgi:hypothetical protein